MARVWLFMAVLLMLPRVLFFSTRDNPEPRFLVQFFPFLAALGGLALAHLGILKRSNS